MTLGKGMIYATSTRQKINIRSSTEGELVDVNDVMPQVLWNRYFLEAQGYDITDSLIYQDNQGAILLENNGHFSSSKRTQHINTQYFFVTNRIASKEVSITYCPTGHMIADFFTKPLQGSLFKKFRHQFLNIDPLADSSLDHRSVLGNLHTTMVHDDGWTMVQHKFSKKKRHGGRHINTEVISTSIATSNAPHFNQLTGLQSIRPLCVNIPLILLSYWHSWGMQIL